MEGDKSVFPSRYSARILSPTPGGVFGAEQSQEDRRRIYLTPAQVALQEQLKCKHSELSRRIALQQAELIRSDIFSL